MRGLFLIMGFMFLNGFTYTAQVVDYKTHEIKTYQVPDYEFNVTIPAGSGAKCIITETENVGTQQFPGVRKRIIECVAGAFTVHTPLVCVPSEKESTVLHVANKNGVYFAVAVTCE